MSATTNIIRQKVMEDFGLTWEQAVEYTMERRYNGLSHEQALAVAKKHNNKGDKK